MAGRESGQPTIEGYAELAFEEGCSFLGQGGKLPCSLPVAWGVIRRDAPYPEDSELQRFDSRQLSSVLRGCGGCEHEAGSKRERRNVSAGSTSLIGSPAVNLW